MSIWLHYKNFHASTTSSVIYVASHMQKSKYLAQYHMKTWNLTQTIMVIYMMALTMAAYSCSEWAESLDKLWVSIYLFPQVLVTYL